MIQDNNIVSQSEVFSLKEYKKYLNSDKNFFIYEIDDNKVDAVYVLQFSEAYNTKVIVYEKGIENEAENVEFILLVLNPLLLILLFLNGNKLINEVLNPVLEVTRSAKKTAIGSFPHLIELPESDDEVRELIETFNTMIFRLKEQVEMIDRFNSDVSHELKTPLTVIQGELELCLKKERDKEYYINSIQNALTHTQEIRELVETLLKLSRYSKETITETFSEVALDSLLINICEHYDKQLKDKKLSLIIEDLEAISLKSNPMMISCIFSNIIDNAIKYTPDGKNIYISLFKRNTRIYFIVRDEGIGISSEQLNKITDRFYRIDESRNKRIKGFGLGLSLVKSYVKILDASLNIESKENSGTTVKVVL